MILQSMQAFLVEIRYKYVIINLGIIPSETV